MRIKIGLWTYLIPLVLCWSIFRLFTWAVQPRHSIENSIYAYGIFLALVMVSMITGYIIAYLEIERQWWVRFLFAIIATILFPPVLIILGGLGIIIIWVASLEKRKIVKIISSLIFIATVLSFYLYWKHNEDANVFYFILAPVVVFIVWICSFKKEQIGCVVTSFLSPIAMFNVCLFVSQSGNIKAFRGAKKGVLLLNHKGSADYFIVALINMFKNWKVMIGENLWTWRWFHFFFNAVGVPIAREGDTSDKNKKAILKSINFLLENEEAILSVYPEGTRNRTKDPLLKLFSGGVRIACETGVPIYLAVIYGAETWRKPGKQIKKSYEKVKEKNFFLFLKKKIKQFHDLVVRVYKEGINPTIVRIHHPDPIQTVGRSYEEVMNEVRTTMSDTYITLSKKGFKVKWF